MQAARATRIGGLSVAPLGVRALPARAPTILIPNGIAQTMYVRQQERTFSQASQLGNQTKFSHLHFYVDKLEPLEEYKNVEQQINEFAKLSNGAVLDYKGFDVELSRGTWDTVVNGKRKLVADYKSAEQDVVKQLMFGAGWRIVGRHEGRETVSYQIASHEGGDESVKVVVTAKKHSGQDGVSGGLVSSEKLAHFEAANLDSFFQFHNGRQGCAVLAFQTNDVDQMYETYKQKHPNLLRQGGVAIHGEAKVFEAYAYYLKGSSTEADIGTVIRFVQGTAETAAFPLSGITSLPKSEISYAGDAVNVCDAYPDHWVSNVYDRVQVLKTFSDVLGFESKVNFNAGVVGAGAAVIESTVTGNDPDTNITNAVEMLKNTDQIFLPINNPLSPHGHVAMYLDQLGQGVQHFASRVKDLPAFISRANRYRHVTGEGFTFLNIPRSYYGFLQEKFLTGLLGNPDLSGKVLSTLMKAGVCDEYYVVKLDCTKAKAVEVLQPLAQEVGSHMDALADMVAKGRYNNIHAFLGDALGEDEYIRLVENQILVDVQGNDVLLQIFTSPVMSRDSMHQAPFFEFIQRQCSTSAAAKPGCGGFGIRNFLTLFLSIEVSNYMDKQGKALLNGDKRLAEGAGKAITVFTNQLNVSNPVLTDMSDVMTRQTESLEKLTAVKAGTPQHDQVLGEIQKLEERKEDIQETLKNIGEDHKKQMFDLIAEYNM